MLYEVITYPAIYQNFEGDIYKSLKKATVLLNKYKKIVLLFPDRITSYNVCYTKLLRIQLD